MVVFSCGDQFNFTEICRRNLRKMCFVRCGIGHEYFILHSARSQEKIFKKILLLKDPFYRGRQFHTMQCDTGIKKGLLESWGISLESQFDITATLLAFYHECCSPIGYATRYLFCCSRSKSP